VATLHCLYSIFHHSRPAGSRPAGSSAAYQLFSGITDLGILPLYAYNAVMTRNTWEAWKQDPALTNTNKMRYMVPSVFYGLVGAGGLHVLSLALCIWLGIMFRRIANMPPDMNPLEANLTSRVHKRNKSSVATASTYTDEKRQLYDDSSRPPSIPFMHTRQNSETSFTSRDSRLNLPSRQYQVPVSDRSPATSQDLKRMSAPPSSHRASYMEVPLGETGAAPSRPTSMYSSGHPSSGPAPSYRAEPVSPAQTTLPRPAKFTETWYTSESLINRTQQRNRATPSQPSKPTSPQRGGYATLDASDSDSEEHDYYHTNNKENPHHPNPLGSHPLATAPPPPKHTTPLSPSSSPSTRRPRTPFSRLRNSLAKPLSTIPLNDRRISGSGDITDQSLKPAAAAGGNEFQPRNRNSSIQPDGAFCFYSKPYGELKAATPPILVGNEGREGGGGRQVSSGNDWADLGTAAEGMGRRRDVSGREAEEGEVRWSRYGVLNE
jgi:hypothetical protein